MDRFYHNFFCYFHIESVVYIFVVVELMCKSKLILMDLIVDLPVTIKAEQLKLPNHFSCSFFTPY